MNDAGTRTGLAVFALALAVLVGCSEDSHRQSVQPGSGDGDAVSDAAEDTGVDTGADAVSEADSGQPDARSDADAERHDASDVADAADAGDADAWEYRECEKSVDNPPQIWARNMPDNLIQNATFADDLQHWEARHASNVNDSYTLETFSPYVVWERTNAGADGGLVGVRQDLGGERIGAPRLLLSVDVWVSYHTLNNSGTWDGSGEMPVKIALNYKDKSGDSHTWTHGFLIDDAAATERLRCNHRTGQWEPASDDSDWYDPREDDGTGRKNFTRVPEGGWTRFTFDLLDSEQRTDTEGDHVLVQPEELIRLQLAGNGWDFRGAVGNVWLRWDTWDP